MCIVKKVTLTPINISQKPVFPSVSDSRFRDVVGAQ